MRMNEFVTRANLDEIAHSSGYAKAQSGSNFGATSSVSFERRTNIDRRNSKIRSYQDSRLAQIRYAKRNEITKSANSSLEAIRSRRAEMSNNNEISKFGGNSNTRNTNRSSMKRDLSQITQSGLAGFHANPAPTQSSSAKFFSIQPKIGR